MIDFLKKVDINDDTIKKLNNELEDFTLSNLKSNDRNCLGIILYLKKIGIKNIDDLLLYKTDWFLYTTKGFIEKFNKRKDELINKISNDNYLEISL